MKKAILLSFLLSVISTITSFGQLDSLNMKYAVSDTVRDDIILFDRDDLMEISLRFDITHYRRKKDESQYFDATLIYHTSPSDSIVKTLKLRPRGISRLSICDFPPIMLNFKKQDSVGGEFSKIDKIKMVTHCSAGGEDYLLKEFLVYKMFNVLTEYSFRVRLVRVNYINTFKESKPIREFAFLIEPVKSLEKRTNSKEIDSAHVTQKHIRRQVMDRMAIFNYMIGNTDWSVPIRHNTLTIAQGQYGGLESGIIIPYDFDYSGLVNTDYAIPFEGLGLESVRERKYLGVCRSESEFLEALAEFRDKKEEIYKVINDFEYLDARNKKEMINYLEGFYKSFDKRNSIVFQLLKDCLEF
ncbi:MAG TPA: hypothetical protein PKX27_13940 [Bacteroidales bacterium]|jgi:hypothetical protein|nr:hypothetical protein [Bacteroidales bacterium]HOX74987.1 hypothetical protein [Bacteroidales bacterium]HPM89080.1 hypothetical protein [Bacteroidales bacterium]HQM68286.1 hypothetical protein [Bacteroidales bacterium]